MEIAIIIGAVIQVVTLIVFFVMAGNISQIKKQLDVMVQKKDIAHTGSEVSTENAEESPKGMLVVELKTEKQMRLGEMVEDGKYKCYRNHAYVGTFAESEFMEFDKWVKEVYKK